MVKKEKKDKKEEVQLTSDELEKVLELRKESERKIEEDKQKLSLNESLIRKEINESYKEITEKYPHCVDSDCIEELSLPVRLAEEMAQYLNEIVYCNDCWYNFDRTKRLWKKGKPIHYVVSNIIDYFEQYISFFNEVYELKNAIFDKYNVSEDYRKEKNIEENRDNSIKLCKKIQRDADKPGFTSHFLGHLTSLLRDDTFVDKLDICKYKLAFKNGILDLTNGEFNTHIGPETMISKYIELEYKNSSEEELKKIGDIIFKICNANEDHKHYYSMAIGQSLTGDASLLKAFFALVGQKGNNGKTTILDSLNVIMPCYVGKISSKSLYEGCSSRHKYISSIKGLRVIYVEENVDGSKLDASFIKEFADGKQINYEVLFGTTSTIEITGNLFILSNNTLVFVSDAGMANRYRQMQFNSSFEKDRKEDDYNHLKFKMDEDLGRALREELAIPLINYFINYSIMFCKDKVFPNLPQDWKEISEDNIESNNPLREFINKYFIICPEGKLTKQSIEKLLKNNDITERAFKDELMRIDIPYCRYKRYLGHRGIWEGIKLIEEDKEDLNESQF